VPRIEARIKFEDVSQFSVSNDAPELDLQPTNEAAKDPLAAWIR